eukprot:TRINITY_DN549_c0_g1_i1.p1 TRINITY_DN549_c0_g1~~TRINITY_DN549_c0_g1_i1.p1  ORF type:complete len:385 (+),score=136.39 TRINITY_DN549_c0_g1_i1:105-1259(+)
MSNRKDEEMDEGQEENNNDIITNDAAQTKYRAAADIANRVLAEVVKAAKPGVPVVQLTENGEKQIMEEVGKTYGKIKDKGVAFPVCVSVNGYVGHVSPLNGETPALVLKEGDLAKVDLGVHLDGYIAVVAHSFVVTDNTAANQAITGKKADVICACHYAAEIAHRLVAPGNTNTQVTEMIAKVAEAFHVSPLEGVLSHQIKRHVIDGNNVIIGKSTLENKTNEFTFEEGQVYGIDIVMSSGEGKTRESTTKTTVFKRAVEQNYNLKLQTSRAVYSEIKKKSEVFPFSLRSLSDEKKARMGITEILSHGLVIPYPALTERVADAVVAQIKFTVLLLKNGQVRITGHQLPLVSSEYKIEDKSVLDALALPTKRTNAKSEAVAMETN